MGLEVYVCVCVTERACVSKIGPGKPGRGGRRDMLWRRKLPARKDRLAGWT